MATKPNALCTVAQVKAEIGIQSSVATFDSVLEVYIDAGTQYIEDYCGRKFIVPDSSPLTQYYDGNQQNTLLLKEWPVRAIDEVYIDSSSEFGSETLVDPTKYRIRDGIGVILLGGKRFSQGIQNVKIVYKGGYEDITNCPSDLNLACIWFAAWSYFQKNRQDLGRTNVSKGDENITITQEVPKQVRALIDKYKRMETAMTGRQQGV